MVHQDSVVGDDGSHRLLVVPCALVVLVLVLMVTACSSVGDEVSAGGSSGEEQPNATAAAQPVGEGVDEPVVTEDGRMIQPAGHRGLWFETEPSDPLERLVYESQRFVGQPVALEPIGERALLPQWEDMPDPCHPEVIRRMEELGIEVVDAGAISAGIVACGLISVAENISEGFGFELVFAEDLSSYSGKGGGDIGQGPEIELVTPSSENMNVGCVAILEDTNRGNSIVASSSLVAGYQDCEMSAYSLQMGINTLGGTYESEI